MFQPVKQTEETLEGKRTQGEVHMHDEPAGAGEAVR